MVDPWIWLAASVLVLAGLAYRRRCARERRWRSDHLVVIGAGRAALALLRAVPDASRSLVLADRNEERIADEARLLGADLVIGPPEVTLRNAAIARAHWIAFVDADGEKNLSLAVLLFSHLAASGAATRDRTVLFEATTVEQRLAVESCADQGGWAQFARILPFDLPSLAARQLLEAHPVEALRIHPARPLRVGIAGQGAIAEALVLALARRGWREPVSLLRVVVATADGGRWMADLTARYPALRELLHLEEVTEIPEHVDEVFAVDTAHERNLLTLSRFQETRRSAGKRGPRLRCLAPDRTTSASERSPGEVLPDILTAPSLFGDAAADLRGALTREETLERMGRAVHELYLEQCVRSGERLGARLSLRAWVDLPEAIKEDNRRQVEGFEASLREIGWRIAPATGSSRQPFSDADVEHLARREHERWMAARKLAGWRNGALRDDAARVHPDLVPFAELPEERRRLSRDAIRRIPLVLEPLGRSVVADVVVAVPVDAEQGVDRSQGIAAARRTMEELRHAYPGRHVQLLSSIATPFEWGFCEAAMAEGATLAVVIDGCCAPRFDEIDRQGQSSVTVLERAAECWIFSEEASGADRTALFRLVAAARAHVHARARS